MLKRLSIAQAFIGNPELIFIDEPLANIDFNSMGQIIEVIDGMKREVSFVIISHIWEPLMPVADLVIAMSNGKIALKGKAGEIQEEVENLFKP